jgi:Holliday junction resolvase
VVVAHDFLTFDAKLDILLERKRGLSADMLNGSGDVSPADFGDLEAPDGGNAFGNEPIDPEDVASLDPDAFEAFCALLWSKNGYSRTIRTPKSGDGGVDIVAIKGGEGVLIQCKSSTVEDRELGWEGVKDVSTGAAIYAARFPGIKFSMVAVTNQRFNGNAKHKAALLHVKLIEREEVEALLAKHPMKRGELERFLLSGWIGSA